MAKISEIVIGNNSPLVLIAGPCVIENREVTFLTAERIIEVTSKLNIPFIFKASFKKANRTSLNSFTGLDFEESLQILNEIKAKFECSNSY